MTSKGANNCRNAISIAIWVLLLSICAYPQKPPPVSGQPGGQVPAALQNIGIDQRLSEQLALDVELRDEQGNEVSLREYFGERPAILAFVYYSCPMLCNQVLNGLVGSLKAVSFDAGSEFNVLTVSFDPGETPEMALSKKTEYLGRYGRENAENGWRFLTGNAAAVGELAGSAGFKYEWDERSGQWAHASGIMVATPEGKLSHYFYGIDYAPRDLRLALVEASEKRIGSPVDRILLYCYHYDPSTGRYGPVIMNFIRAGGFATFLGIAILILLVRRREAAKRRFEQRGREGPGRGAIQFALIPFAPEQASSVAGDVDLLYTVLWLITILFSSIITLGIIYFVLRYRRTDPNEVPRPVDGSMKLEAIWIAIPFIIAMVIFGWGAKVYFAMTRQPSEALDIYVVGKQWMWKFQHPDGRREINELHVPVDRNVRLTLGTEDVIHSFYVPAFRIKTDVVPGRYMKTWFKATKPGRYQLFCAEYCGTKHSGMIGWIVVMEPRNYQLWMRGQVVEEPLSVSGKRLFEMHACHTCHLSDGSGQGPRLEGLFNSQVKLQSGEVVAADEDYLRESIVNPGARITAGYLPIMPTYQGRLTEEELMQLVAYIKSLDSQPGGAGGSSGSAPSKDGEPRPREN